MKQALKWYLPIFLICLALNLWGFYYYMFLANNVSVTTSYVGKMAYTEEDKFFINVDYWSNENNNGVENFSVRLDYYTDTDIPQKQEDGSYGKKYTYSTGVQFKNGCNYSYLCDTNYFTYAYTKYKLIDCYYYNSDNDDSFYATNSLKDMNHWVYDLKGQLCLIEEKGSVQEDQALWVKQGTVYDTSLLITELYKVVKSLDDGEQIITLDLSKYYNIYLYDTNAKKFDKGSPATTDNYVFLNCYVNKSRDGLVSASQSMFGAYMGKTDWSLYDFESTNYWKAISDYDLTIEDCTVLKHDDGYYLKLQSECIDYIKEFKNIYIRLTVDLDNIYLVKDKLEVKGLDKTAFGDAKVNELVLKSATERTFKVYDNNLTIVKPDNIKVDYMEVIA